MKLVTIGFTRKSAEEFFGILKGAGVRTLVDIRRRNSSQLAGFTQGRDLPFFLEELVGADYLHVPALAPSEDLLQRYRKGIDWADYEREFGEILDGPAAREALQMVLDLPGPVCLLCTEPTPERCHRRLVAERLQALGPGLAVEHLVKD